MKCLSWHNKEKRITLYCQSIFGLRVCSLNQIHFGMQIGRFKFIQSKMVNNFHRLNKLFVHIRIGLREGGGGSGGGTKKNSTCNNRKIFSRWYIIKLGILFSMSRTYTFSQYRVQKIRKILKSTEAVNKAAFVSSLFHSNRTKSYVKVNETHSTGIWLVW